jgi:leucyl aminopeptidase
LRTIEVRSGPLEELDVDVVAVPVPPQPTDLLRRLDTWTGEAISRCREQGVLRGKDSESLFFPCASGRPHVLLLGADAPLDSSPDSVRSVAGRAVRFCRDQRLGSLALALEHAADARTVQAAAEGLVLGDFAYLALKRGEEVRSTLLPSRAMIWSPDLVSGAEEWASLGWKVAEAQNVARSLVARPGNVLTPAGLADEALDLADRGCRVDVWDVERLRDKGFGALLAVAKGSHEAPRFIIVEHRGRGGAPVVLVGKGITFDSGGISLKPAKGMEEMKHDMAGAAAVLGTMRALSEIGAPQRVVGLIPTAENLPSGRALKPGDVVRGVSGRSIEVVNTDAEGRLILSDALAFGARMEPVALVDIATLTGGCVVALGKQAAGLLSNDELLAGALIEAGTRTGERAWRLPLWPEYRKQLDSDIADIKNSGGREASPITAAKFLEEFVDDVPWAHLDIAGTAWAEDVTGWQPKGATGFGVRLLVEWVRGLG